MKTLKLNFGILALIITLAVALTSSAFKPAANLDESGPWFFNGTTATSADSWDRVQEGYTCGDASSEPCQIVVPTGKTLQEYLTENSANILAISIGRRE